MVGAEVLCAANSPLGMTTRTTSPIAPSNQRIGVIVVLTRDELEHNRSTYDPKHYLSLIP